MPIATLGRNRNRTMVQGNRAKGTTSFFEKKQQQTFDDFGFGLPGRRKA
jgi:hypothetical protein